MSEETDLSGEWLGRYVFPAAVPAVTFEAVIAEGGGALVGTIQEVDNEGRFLTATLSGQRNGLDVNFLKLYDAADWEYDHVLYDGHISDDGKEIAGQWSIPEVWSGTFIMVRKQGAQAGVEIDETVKLDAP